MRSSKIIIAGDGIPTLTPDAPVTIPLPRYVARIQDRLSGLERLNEDREQNSVLLDRESGQLNSRLLTVNPDDTEALQKLAFGEQRVALIERRVMLLDDAIKATTEDLANLNAQAKSRLETAAARYDRFLADAEIEEKLAVNKNPKVTRETLEHQSKQWPKIFRDNARGIHWDDRDHPEKTASRILGLAEEIFTNAPALALE